MIVAADGGPTGMSKVTGQISTSLDGFVAGPNQSVENPIGERGMGLHQWVFATRSWREQSGLEGGDHNADSEVVDDVVQGVGAYIMGRNMFGGGSGAWDDAWTGWWGDDPPYHAPVFVLTHHPRAPLVDEGRHHVHLRHRRDRARIAAGAQRGRRAGRRDRRRRKCRSAVPRRPVCSMSSTCTSFRSSSDRGERLLEDVGDPTLEPLKVVASPTVTHVKYRVVRSPDRLTPPGASPGARPHL